MCGAAEAASGSYGITLPCMEHDAASRLLGGQLVIGLAVGVERLGVALSTQGRPGNAFTLMGTSGLPVYHYPCGAKANA